MDNRYEVFCLADRHFYESLDRLSSVPGDGPGDGSFGGPSAVPLFDTARRPVPEGWRTARDGDWLHLDPPAGSRPYPAQGWKVHASATLASADKVAAKVWDYCVPRHIAFKFVPGPQLLHLRNSKYAGRDTSGKFVTVYPADEQVLHAVLDELGALLDGEPGPYILTDLRWRQGPLYVRYGAFAKRYCVGARGTLVPAVEDGQGRLVPDDRSPAFHVPDWVALPDFLAPQLAARNATTVTDLPYRIDGALHFSNGGGVYTGTDTRTGEKVVLKEGRPHAGLASDGADAVTRLRRERDALRRLSGLGVAPGVRDWLTVGDHRFLVMDFVEGKTLNSFFGHRHPLLRPDPDPAAVAEYTRWALRIHAGVERAVAAVHSRGLVFNDLHMFNIMVGPDEESVSLLDFEAAAPATDNGRQAVAHPGFLAPPDRRGTAVDRYALACLRLALFLPVTTLFAVDRGKAAHLAEVIAREFPVPPGFLAQAVTEIACGGPHGPTGSAALSSAAPGGAVVGGAAALGGGSAGLGGSAAGGAAAPAGSAALSSAALGGGSVGLDGSAVTAPAAPGGGSAGSGGSAAGGAAAPAGSVVTAPAAPGGESASPGGFAAGGAAVARGRGASAAYGDHRLSRHEGAALPAPSLSPDLHVQAAAAAAEGDDDALGRGDPAYGGSGYLPVRVGDWEAARESMAAAILSSATPERRDRLFPGDIAQFSDGGGLGLAHGAAGVLYAFDQVGLARYEQGEQWLLDRTAELPNGIPLGLYDGVAGIAYALDLLGHTDRALALIRTLLGENWQRLSSDLSGGLAGIGLVLDHLAARTGEAALHDRALEAAGIVAERLATAPPQDGGTPRRAGLMRGATGPALLFLRLYERTGVPALLAHAARALARDLDSCTTTGSGSLEVDEGWRTMPYLGDGSAGIGAVLDDLLGLAAAGDLEAPAAERFARARAGIVRAATARLYAQPGLFAGRSGMILHLARTTAPGVPGGALLMQVDALGWYGMDYRGELAFPGNQMMRLSMDLGTGTAGCLLALGAANAAADPGPTDPASTDLAPTGSRAGRRVPALPFLPPPPAP